MRHVVSAIYRFWWCRAAGPVAARAAVGDIQKETNWSIPVGASTS
jgi:hypothetical protein